MPNLAPENPSSVMTIRNVTPSITTLSLPFARFGRIAVGGRATLVKLSQGGLAVFSPVAWTAEVENTVKQLGPDVKYIVAPDIEHHLFLSTWAERFPKAQVIAPEGLAEARKIAVESGNTNNGLVSILPFSTIFTKANKATTKIGPDFDQDFDYEYVDGHKNRELVFFHRPDRTLIEADLLFNLPANEQYSKCPEANTNDLANRIFRACNRSTGNLSHTRRTQWHLFASDRASYSQSVKRIDGWDFDRLIPAHGDVIETGAKSRFRDVMDWFLKA